MMKMVYFFEKMSRKEVGGKSENLKNARKTRLFEAFLIGGGNWDRTNDLMHVKHTL